MQYLQKLPLLIALLAALLTGFSALLRSVSHKEIMLQMIVVMVLFYIFGLVVRSTIIDIQTQQEEKRKEHELEEKKKQEQEDETGILGQNIDFLAGDDSDSFDPLPVSEFIKNKLNQD